MNAARPILAAGDFLLRLILRPIVGAAAIAVGTTFVLLCWIDRWLANGSRNLGDWQERIGRKSHG
jgi:hypothetical protein